MKNRKKIGKLVRDNIPDIVLKNGEKCSYVVLKDEEFLVVLRKKIVEEAFEVSKSDDNRQMIEEIGDLLDVVDVLIKVCGLSVADIDNARKIKNEKCGGFNKRIFLQETYKE